MTGLAIGLISHPGTIGQIMIDVHEVDERLIRRRVRTEIGVDIAV
jgi:hypothetical protein